MKISTQLYLVMIFLLSSGQIFGQKRIPCNGDYKDKKITHQEFKSILDKHKEWIEAYDLYGRWDNREIGQIKTIITDPRKANLCNGILDSLSISNSLLLGARLNTASFNHTDLSNSNLNKAEINSANLNYSKIVGTTFVDAKLRESSLIGANLDSSNFTKTSLFKANLSNALLTNCLFDQTTFNRAVLDSANLQNSIFKDADLKEASLVGANLTNVVFELKSNGLPNIASIAKARNIEKMSYTNTAYSLITLREAFKNAGLLEQERKVTYAILVSGNEIRYQGNLVEKISALFRDIFFKWTSEYGMNPNRAILLLFISILLFAIPYSIAVRKIGKDGIWKVWDEKRVRQDLGNDEPEKVYRTQLLSPAIYGLKFSIQSAFQIGWRDFNIGNWISKMEPEEFYLKPTGWIKSVAGIQSILSMYLLAIWILTTFGRPFNF